MSRYWLWQLLAVMFMGLAGYGAWRIYDLGKLHGAVELEALRREHADLLRHANDLEKSKRELRRRYIMLERSGQIDQQANLEIRQGYGSLQEELQSVREELEFYRGIVSPGDVPPGLRIHRFELSPLQEGGGLSYELILIQVKKNDRPISGTITMAINGLQDGKPAKLDLADVTDPQTGQLKFKFRYFQKIRGQLQLPPDFRPLQVELAVDPVGKNNRQEINRTFE